MTVYQARLARLRAGLERLGAQAILVSQPESRQYLSGYTGHDLPPRDPAGYLYITANAAYLLTDGRTAEMARAEAPDYEVIVYPNVELSMDAVADLTRKLGVRRVAFENIHLPYLIWERLCSRLEGAAEVVAANELIDELRISKDAAELRELEAAVAVLDDCFRHLTWNVLRPGLTERQIAWEVESYLKQHGSEPSFPSIIASGPNAAIPHAPLTDREIRPGEPL